MSDTWGTWIEHDGRGCPVPLGMIVRIEIVLACEDQMGGSEGSSRFQECVLNEASVENPMWVHSNFGREFVYTDGDFCGGLWFAGKIIRYRIRKPRGMSILEPLLADLPVKEPDQ